MSYFYPPYPIVPAPPTIPTALPNPPLVYMGLDSSAAQTLQSGYDGYIVFSLNAILYLPLSTNVYSKPYYVKNWGATSVTIIPTSPESLDGITSKKMEIPYQSFTLIPWPGVGWMLV